MGKTISKNSQQEGNTNIEINEHIEQNNNAHDAHELKLWLIIALLCIQLAIKAHSILRRKWKRQGFEKARALSVQNIQMS